MAEHAHTTPTPAARRRGRPAAGGVIDRRDPSPRRAGIIKPITYAERQAIERNIELAIEFLNALDGDSDLDAGEQDCCEAGDDDASSSIPVRGVQGYLGSGSVGDPDDAEDVGDDEPDDEREVTDADEGEPTPDDVPGRAWDASMKPIATPSRGCPGIFQSAWSGATA